MDRDQIRSEASQFANSLTNEEERMGGAEAGIVSGEIAECHDRSGDSYAQCSSLSLFVASLALSAKVTP